MKLFQWIIAISIFFAASCKTEDVFETDCVSTKIEEYGMVAYNGQDIGCNFFLMLYQYDGEQFFLLGSHCADMASYPIDCNGNKLCENDDDINCDEFYDHAEFVGIIGIKE